MKLSAFRIFETTRAHHNDDRWWQWCTEHCGWVEITPQRAASIAGMPRSKVRLASYADLISELI